MNKIILLGHPSSGLERVEALLKESGMQSAQPSKRDGLLPHHITDTLCQAHDCAPLGDAMTEDDLAPQPAGTVWHGLALDLLLGNLQQPLWGWADARSIYWLDYWAQLDPHMTFVMVYDHPISALQSSAAYLIGDALGRMDMAVPRHLENWQAYNGAMLRFYSRQPERCLLVNTQRARQQLADYLAQLGDKLHHSHTLALEYSGASAQSTSVAEQHPTLALAIEQGGGSQQLLSKWFGADSAVERHLLTQLLQEHPLALQIYEELEAATTVRANHSSSQAVHPGEAWIQLIEQRQAMAQLTLSLYEQLLEQQQKHISAQSQLAPAPDTSKLKNLEEENDLLLTQLHQVQEELERYYLENKDLKKNQTKAKAKPYGAAQRIQQQLSYRLGAAMIANSHSLSGWLRMPFALRGEMKAYRAEKRAKAGQNLPPIHTYADAYDAERYRQHLSFQLGQTLLKYAKTPWGWMWMPFALVSTAKAFKKARA